MAPMVAKPLRAYNLTSSLWDRRRHLPFSIHVSPSASLQRASASASAVAEFVPVPSQLASGNARFADLELSDPLILALLTQALSWPAGDATCWGCPAPSVSPHLSTMEAPYSTGPYMYESVHGSHEAWRSSWGHLDYPAGLVQTSPHSNSVMAILGRSLNIRGCQYGQDHQLPRVRLSDCPGQATMCKGHCLMACILDLPETMAPATALPR